MTDENTMSKTSDTPTAALPTAPNGHGASNGVLTQEPHVPSQATESAKHIQTASKTKKKKKRHQHDKTSPPPPVESAAIMSTDQATQTEPTEISPLTAAPPIAEIAAAPIDESPSEPSAMTPIDEQAEEPIVEPVANLRLRMKIWTDHRTAKRYLMPTAFMRDVVNGRPISDVMYAYAMSDDDTQIVTLTAGEWNALPFFYFQEDGPAPRASARPVDEVASKR